MTSIKAFIKGHPVAAYSILAFAISWGGILLVVGPGGFPGIPEQFETLLPLVGLAMLIGPPVAGILLTSLFNGRAGLREFLIPVAQVAGGRPLVCGGAPYRPTLDADGDAPCALAPLPRVPPLYIHIRR